MSIFYFYSNPVIVDYKILLFFLVVIAIGLPLSILGEFGSLNTLRFYAQLYPHIIVYPSLFLPLSLFSLYRAFSLILKKTGIILMVTTLIAFASITEMLNLVTKLYI